MHRLAALALLLAATVPLQADDRESTLERIKREGVLRWGADPSGGAPFCFPDPTLDEPGGHQRIVGFEVELIERLARRLQVQPVLVQGDWNSLIPSLKAERIDLVFNGLEITEERGRQVRLTAPYFRYHQQLTVRATDRERFRNLGDLKGRPVAVLNGSASVDVLLRNGWSKDDIVELDDSLKPFDFVKQGRADACLCESIIAAYYTDGDDELHVQPEQFAPGLYAGAVRKEDDDLQAELNAQLKEMKESGELGELYQRWGIWDDGLEKELGIAKGTRQDMIPLARKTFVWTWPRLGRLALLLLEGAGLTLLLTAISMPLALLFGLGLALMAMSKRRWLRWPAVCYIQVIRGTPLLVQIYVIFFGLPVIGHLLGLGNLLTWDAFYVGILCLSANYAAYEAEIHRAGIQAVPKGQREAALALGMSERQAFLTVVLPQSLRIIMPPVINDLVSMLKDSCLVSVMGVYELLFVASSIGKATFLYGQLLIAAAVLYLILSLMADRLGKALEERLKRRGFRLAAQPLHH